MLNKLVFEHVLVIKPLRSVLNDIDFTMKASIQSKRLLPKSLRAGHDKANSSRWLCSNNQCKTVSSSAWTVVLLVVASFETADESDTYLRRWQYSAMRLVNSDFEQPMVVNGSHYASSVCQAASKLRLEADRAMMASPVGTNTTVQSEGVVKAMSQLETATETMPDTPAQLLNSILTVRRRKWLFTTW
eukprot:m.38815 g.38815  ORF g.38815 m.38815 type:complete len:188 (-) comp12620_c0_seq2:97-660(-)